MKRLKWLHLTPVIAAMTSFSVTAAAQDAPAPTAPPPPTTEATQSPTPPEVPAQAAPPPPATPTPAPAPAVEEEKPLPPGSFKVPGTQTVLTLSGYAQMDLTYDIKGRQPNVEGSDWAIHAAALPLDKNFEVEKKSGQLYLTARTSRIGISTATPTDFADIGTRIEGDFNIGNLLSGQTFTNSVLFRLRHAYGTLTGKYGTLLIGQSWSTFLDLPSYADTVDFNGPGSIPLIRQPQVRYTIPFSSAVSLSLAAENAPGTDQNGITDSGTTTRRMQTIPDGIAKLAIAGDWGSVAAGGMTTQYKWAGRGPDDDAYSKQGWGANLAMVFKFLENDKIRAYAAGGRGIGRYLFNAGVGGQTAIDRGQDDISLHDAMAYHIGYTRGWTKQVRTSVTWSQTLFKFNNNALPSFDVGTPAAPGSLQVVGGDQNKRIDQLFINTFWSPVKQVAFGIEYAFAQRTTFGNDNAPNDACDASNPGPCASQKGTMHRVTTSAHFDFF